MAIYIKGVRVEFQMDGGLVFAAIGEPRAQEFVTAADPLEAMRSVLRKLSHAPQSDR